MTRPAKSGASIGTLGLGRAEAWLRTLAVFIWAFLGGSRLAGGSTGPWTLVWVLYGAALLASFLHAKLPRALGLALLLLQSVSVLPMPWLGFGGFEGLLLSMVVAQSLTLVPLRVAVAWAALQLVPLLAVTAPYKRPLELMEIAGAYSTFSAFALVTEWLRQNEVRATRGLALANAELSATRAELVTAVKQGERLRISRELHDSLGHHLTALRIQLELASQGESAALQSAQVLARTALGEVRQVVGALQIQDSTGLASAVRLLAAAIPSPRIEVTIPDAVASEGSAANHVLLRCIQEAITNSLKHSGATMVQVRVAVEASMITLTVHDDGRGSQSFVPGHGLQSIAARAAELGGSATFGSAASGGFEVQVQFPRGNA